MVPRSLAPSELHTVRQTRSANAEARIIYARLGFAPEPLFEQRVQPARRSPATVDTLLTQPIWLF